MRRDLRVNLEDAPRRSLHGGDHFVGQLQFAEIERLPVDDAKCFRHINRQIEHGIAEIILSRHGVSSAHPMDGYIYPPDHSHRGNGHLPFI